MLRTFVFGSVRGDVRADLDSVVDVVVGEGLLYIDKFFAGDIINVNLQGDQSPSGSVGDIEDSTEALLAFVRQEAETQNLRIR